VGVRHREPSILKPEDFEVSLCHAKYRIQVRIVEGKKMTINRVRIKRLQEHMIIPTKGSRMAAGHDIYALEDGTIPAQRQMLVDTRIAIGFPKGTYGRLVARASMAVKAAGKCRSVVQGGPECSWSTKGDCGPRGPPGPLRSILIHTFGNFTENVDQGGSGWTRRTRGTITPLVGPGLVFKFC